MSGTFALGLFFMENILKSFGIHFISFLKASLIYISENIFPYIAKE